MRSDHRKLLYAIVISLFVCGLAIIPIFQFRPVLAAVDDAYTVALLHMNGADASTTFTDEAGHTFTARGTAQIDTAQSVFGDASGLFDGNSDWIDAPDSNDWYLDGGSNSNTWTIDFRVRFNGDPGTSVVGFVSQYASNAKFWAVSLNNNSLYFTIRSSASNVVNLSNSWDPASATWYHIAIVKNGTSGYMMFVNGNQIGSTQTDTDTMSDLSGILMIGKHVDLSGVSRYLNGWMDEVRISKGVARWTENFTPPTAEYAPPPAYTDTPTHTVTSSETSTFTPSMTVTQSLTPSKTPTETVTPSDTFTPSKTPTETVTPSETSTPSLTPSETSTPSVTSSVTMTFTPTITDTPTETMTPSITFTPTITNTPTETLTPTVTRTTMPAAMQTGTYLAAVTYYQGIAEDSQPTVIIFSAMCGLVILGLLIWLLFFRSRRRA